jgi:monomeric sarcosine oxidase
MGMAAGWFLARAGRKVLLLDPGDPPHEGGAHHGDTRLIRHAYGEGAAYVPLALRAHELWLEAERAAQVKLFERTGIINAAPADDPFLAEVQRSASVHGLDLQGMDGREANRRWPAWRLPGDYAVCFEPDAGVLYCGQAVGALRRLATGLGAALRVNTPVARLEPQADGTVRVIAESGEAFAGRHAIVCAGRSTPGLVGPLGLVLPVTRLRKTFAWFDGDPRLFAPEDFPGFAVLTELGFHYGFPSLLGKGLKAGRHDGGQPVAADAPLAPFSPADRQDIEAFLRRHLPGSGQLREGRTCEYDMTPDEHFIVDRVPGLPQVQVATGFSGHGFKFATAIGEALAQRVTQGECTADLSLFACRRFASESN